VDGDVTGVAGGYIVSIRLVRADSGIELASFRETGDGPRGLIDAADRLARALRSKAGESLRSVNATPPLFRTTTSSLPALRKYSEAVRLNSMANDSAVILLREAVAIDSSFASAWSTLGAFLGNYGGSRSAIDSAVTRAYRLRNPLTAEERDRMTATYFGLGPGRDRAKAIAAYEAIIARGDSGSVLVNLGERLRTRREYARAESLNLASFKRSKTGTSMANAIEMQINQGKVKDAVASLELLKATAPDYAGFRIPFVLYAAGGANQALRSALDSLRKVKSLRVRNNATYGAAAVALLDGRLRERDALLREIPETAPGFLQTEPLEAVALQAALTGPSAQLSARLDAAIAQIPFKDMAVVDRPYLDAGYALARAGNAAKARAMLARYKAEVTDTAYLRSKAAEVHAVLGEIALAEQRPQDALTEFRLSDVSYDGKPADECAACVPFDLARAFDAAGQSDSAAVMFERYLSTPYWLKAIPSLDMVRLPAIHERLGQIYESKGNTDKAVEHYRAFIELWKNADPELQPRVTAAKERLKKLTPVERPKH
jgi:tetratricopeptide (TPR) repeat protein